VTVNLPFPRKQWTKQEKQQFKKLTKIDLISLLDKDKNWESRGAKGNRYVFYNSQYKPPHDHLTIHYHREGFKNIGLLLHLLDHWCCTRDDLKRWKVIK